MQQTVTPKSCDGCTACCKHLAIEELNKPVGWTCKHVCATGCSIYFGRPKSCVEYSCWYKQGMDIERPDRSKVIIDAYEEMICIREMEPGAAEWPRNMESIKKIAGHLVCYILRPDGSIRSVLGPEHEVAKMTKRLDKNAESKNRYRIRNLTP